ncbi:SAM (S-ADENOSYL METHIONINE) TRANSPORTER [Salix purpurea]|uniref:SAM (S-ADENOSYL METHIONINE) TRANSPORTER n=1 Tax=Salix purpurea TaxID=77065 RepID=A0A9Q0V1I7_SALPP|nr:SAM (S-ADENOSYL METHIONINE) TRANSPORTER [Salix purpurea]
MGTNFITLRIHNNVLLLFNRSLSSFFQQISLSLPLRRSVPLSNFPSILPLPLLSRFRYRISFFHFFFFLAFILIFRFCFAAMEGVWSVYGDFEFVYSGTSKEQILFSLILGFGSSLLLAPLLAFLFDSIGGHNKACLVFCVLHLFVGIWKRIVPQSHPCVWLLTLSSSLATGIFSFAFEAWIVLENENQGYRLRALTNTFWLMTFIESASLIGSQVLVNWLLASDVDTGIASSSTATIFIAIIGIFCVTKGWKQTPHSAPVKDRRWMSYINIFSDKRILLLGFAHACLQFSIAIFWILWAPTLVADGREVHLGLIYPCLMGARMLGSTVCPWLFCASSSLRIEDCLVYTFTVMGLALSIVAYDYQEIGVLVSLFCLFHAGVGLIIPSLARLRTIHVPNELRGGMISLSVAPANAAILFLLILRGYYQNIENSTMVALAALGLFMASGSMHLLKRLGKQPFGNWHKS